jgi:hypothetical protein
MSEASKEAIIQYYCVENHSRGACYEYFHVSSYAFKKLLEKYNIKKAPEKVNVSKKDFYEYFITQNHTWEETALHFNISKNQAVNLGRRYNIKKPSYLFSQHVTDMNNRRWANCSEEEKEAFKQKISNTKQALPNEEKKARAARGYETRRKNGTITTSSPEEATYAQLCALFSTEDVVRQYKSKLYPFHCDFYIKSLDLYIELNLHWAHGEHLFDKYNKYDLEKLTIWQSKADAGNNYYKRAITTWTIRDPLKFETAKKNNLNYIVLYNDNEIVSYLNSLQQAIPT